jgi:hypothetical protein
MLQATFEGWMAVMDSGVDAVGVGKQPDYEANFGAYAYFVLFIVVGAFFAFNLFIGVIIEKFQDRKKAMHEEKQREVDDSLIHTSSTSIDGGGDVDGGDGSADTTGVMLTRGQQKLVATFRTAFSAKPKKLAPSPGPTWRKWCHAVALSPKFEVMVMGMIVINTIFFMLMHYDQSATMDSVLKVANTAFTVFYGLEVGVTRLLVCSSARLLVLVWGSR